MWGGYVRMPAITALAIVENIDSKGSMLEVIGYSDGRVDLSISSTTTSPKTVMLHDSDDFSGEVAVTAIAVTNPDNGYVKVIIGFSNALLLIIGVNLKSSTPQIKDSNGNYVSKGYGGNPCITGIGIINDCTIAVALSNKMIRIFIFSPDLIKNQGDKSSIRNAGQPTIPCASEIETTAILPITTSSGMRVAIYVYVLTKDKKLKSYKYGPGFEYSIETFDSGDKDVSKISTPASGSSRIVFTTTNNEIWKIEIDEHQNREIKPIDMSRASFKPDVIPTITAMASNNNTFRIRTTADDDGSQPPSPSLLSKIPFLGSTQKAIGPTTPPTITALAIIEELEESKVETRDIPGAHTFHNANPVTFSVKGYSDGRVIFTNTATKTPTVLKTDYLPKLQPAVTAITTLIPEGKDYAIVIIGFSNAYFVVIRVSHNGGILIIHNPNIKRDLSQSSMSDVPRITGIGILTKKYIAVALHNNTIEIIGFDQDLERVGDGSAGEIVLHKRATMKCLSGDSSIKLQTAAILSITGEGADERTVKIYTLFSDCSLYFYEYEQDAESPNLSSEKRIASNVSKLTTPHTKSNRLVYTTTNGEVWQKGLGKDQPAQKIPGIPIIPNITAIALTTTALHYCTTDAPNNVQQRSLPALP